jgi:hypothetical protein
VYKNCRCVSMHVCVFVCVCVCFYFVLHIICFTWDENTLHNFTFTTLTCEMYIILIFNYIYLTNISKTIYKHNIV